MGTSLHARGLPFDRCYEELNLSAPELIQSIHEEFLLAGAEIFETNTFGANSIRLARHGLQHRVFEINQAGAEIARRAAQITSKQPTRVWIAGAIGPLGISLAPNGPVTPQTAFAAYSEQIRGLAAGGVDMLIIETVTALDEAEQALAAAHSVAPHLPVMVMVTVDERCTCLDGSTPEIAAKRCTEWGADAIGCNCSHGPANVLQALERMAAVTDMPLAAMPNAGLPRVVDGRSVYDCSPQQMAGFARRFVDAGVQFLGGCCGTTPDHIREIASALRATDAEKLLVSSYRAATDRIGEMPSVPNKTLAGTGTGKGTRFGDI